MRDHDRLCREYRNNGGERYVHGAREVCKQREELPGTVRAWVEAIAKSEIDDSPRPG